MQMSKKPRQPVLTEKWALHGALNRLLLFSFIIHTINDPLASFSVQIKDKFTWLKYIRTLHAALFLHVNRNNFGIIVIV